MKNRRLAKGEVVEDEGALIQQSKRNTSFHYKVSFILWLFFCSLVHGKSFLQIVVNGKEHLICKSAFGSLHGIKKGRVNRIAALKVKSGVPPIDKRGQSEGSRVRKKSAELVEQVKAHINSFPLRGSHYSRKKNIS